MSSVRVQEFPLGPGPRHPARSRRIHRPSRPNQQWMLRRRFASRSMTPTWSPRNSGAFQSPCRIAALLAFIRVAHPRDAGLKPGLQPAGGIGHRAEQGAALVHGFFPLGGGVGIVHDAGTGLHMQATVLDHRGADGDGGVGVALPADVADRTGVDVALDRFQFADDFQCADLGCAADRAGGNAARSTSMEFKPSSSSPSTWLTICMTCE
jgi:hypothetical protein